MPQVTTDTVHHVAKLARLTLTDAEVSQFADELTKILGMVDQLNEADVSAVADAVIDYNHPVVTRPDVARQSQASQSILAHAPVAEDQCFQVPKILEG
jgi:aspartyl-tRNA(Asn)/glutamyl-tRNA(Gln) amidotransferase subunit C